MLEALQRPDLPYPGSGAAAAFAFTLPADVAPAAPTTPGGGRRARSWGAAEAWLDEAGFESYLSTHPAASLLRADGHEITAPLVFGGRAGRDAVQAFTLRTGGAGAGVQGAPPPRTLRLSLCLRRVDEAGPWKGCWLVSGLRMGDYSV